MIKIGMMIGNRYEILEKIGTGGMSDVYKAKCHKLNRYVAVKVLKQEFSDNANFLSKFRTEAQAAAGLMHPNIVNVYDVGEENGIYYIVMELVEGITLKKYIEKKFRLSYKEAVSIAIQVSMGIEAAHKNHIIHRDIKPQNIMISRDGKVKVTDFGIAKAATSNTITSNVMGSVHYTSPEQARGGYSDEKSDIYSLGITLFEMLTGRVPFNGETTVAIAIKQIQDEMPYPSEFVPDIPYGVEQIVMKCCQKSPDRRYQNMGELIADLKQSLIDPDGDFVVSTIDTGGRTRTVSEQEFDQIKQNSHRERSRKKTQEEHMRLKREPEPAYEEDYPEEGDDYDYDPKMERVTTVLAILAGIVICGMIVFLLVKVFDVFNRDDGRGPGNLIDISSTENSTVPSEEHSTSSEPSESDIRYVEMIDMTGWALGDARSWLLRNNLFYEEVSETSEEIAEGLVIEIRYADDGEEEEPIVVGEGDVLEEGTAVKIVISLGKGEIPIPQTVGMNYESARVALEAAGFVVVRQESQSDTVAAGLVIAQSPEGNSSAEEGTEVTVTVSVRPPDGTVRMPNLIGLTEEAAIDTIVDGGFVLVNVSYVYHSQIPAGQVCYQNYSQGSYVMPGTGISIQISNGPQP